MNSEPTVLNRKEKQRSREYREIEKLVCVKGGVTNYLFPCFIPGVHFNLDKPTLKIMLRMKKMKQRNRETFQRNRETEKEKYRLSRNVKLLWWYNRLYIPLLNFGVFTIWGSQL